MTIIGNTYEKNLQESYLPQDFDIQKFAALKGNGAIDDPQAPDVKKPEGTQPKPDAPTSPATPSALPGLCSTLSPGAWLAILCVKEAAKENEESTKNLLAHGKNIQDTLEKQAKNILKGAVAQLVCTVVSAGFSMVTTAVAGCKTMGRDPNLQGIAAEQAMVAPKNWNAAGKLGEQLGGSVGNFVNSLYASENKKLDATIENSRTMMEGLRNHMQMQRDLSNKALDFYSAMQANMNQTRAKILG